MSRVGGGTEDESGEQEYGSEDRSTRDWGGNRPESSMQPPQHRDAQEQANDVKGHVPPEARQYRGAGNNPNVVQDVGRQAQKTAHCRASSCPPGAQAFTDRHPGCRGG